jgi:hypothetical protein
VEKGKPDKKEEWAFTTIVSCPVDVGPAGATAIRKMRTESDTATLFATWSELALVIDARLMAAYLEVLADAAASIPARVFAIDALLTQELSGRGGGDYAELVGRGADCSLSFIAGTHAAATIAMPLPSGHRQSVRAALMVAANSSTAPAAVKSASLCALTFLPP